ncbi:glycosyltransferase [Selenomonas sp. KH1T6]|uniref:glycosyltransferase n=1 Tax=Selenomonas sp. KH1T6 TaxID=3158784 RepID=UPI0008A75114|nr:Lipopolysaccharide biosynthesis protein, LPS:glycosyltransferase [Selenomonas ruminantium]
MKEICVYIAGDKRIINQSIVTLKSVKEYNDMVDIAIFQPDANDVTDEQRGLCKRLGIFIVGLENVGEEYTKDFGSFSRWPKEVWLNYIAPNYLEKRGYKYAIKMDYDMLCVKKFNLEELLPGDHIISYCEKRNSLSNFIEKKDVTQIENEYNIIFDAKIGTANVGFIVFDLKEYVKRNIANIFKDLYVFFIKKEIKVYGEFIEQFLFSLLQLIIRIRFKKIPFSYNSTASYMMYNDECVVIHYNTDIKPWIDYKDYTKIAISFYNAGNDEFKQLLLFNPWRRICNQIGFKNFFCPEPFSDFELVKIHQDFSYFTFKERYRKQKERRSIKAFEICGNYDLTAETTKVSVIDIAIRANASNHNFFRYDIFRANSIYVITFSTKEENKFFTAGVFDFKKQEVVFFNEYLTGNEVYCSFVTGAEILGLSFLIYAGECGKTAGESLFIEKINVKTIPILNKLSV